MLHLVYATCIKFTYFDTFLALAKLNPVFYKYLFYIHKNYFAIYASQALKKII